MVLKEAIMLELQIKEKKKERVKLDLKVSKPVADTTKILKEISEANLVIQSLKKELDNLVESKK